MSPPIRDGSGNSIGSIRLGDGSEISEVRTGAGDVLFSAIPDSEVYDFETGDVSEWDNVNDLSAVQNRVFNGSFAGRCDTAQQDTHQANVVAYSGGKQVPTAEYYRQTGRDHSGGGIRYFNSNGNVEFGIANDSPELYIDDGNGQENVNNGSNFSKGDWVFIDVSLDWNNSQFDVTWTNENTNDTYSEAARPMKHGVDIEMVQIDDATTGGNTGDFWQDGFSIGMWFDDIRLFA